LSHYLILESQFPFKTWTPEKFLTGRKLFFSLKEARNVKKKLENMGGTSIKYKVSKKIVQTERKI